MTEQRLSAGTFIVLGLITFWVYTALRCARALRTHLARRWAEVEERGELRRSDARLAALRKTGFSATVAGPWSAAALFGLSAVLLAGSLYKGIFFIAGASAALFYAALLLVMLWALATLRGHEMLELHVRERGAGAVLEVPEPGDEVARRWERHTSHVIAFLVLAAPVAFSPFVGAPLAIWLPLAAVFHVWGSMLLVRLYNDHLAEEERHTMTTSVRSAGAAPTRPMRARVAIMLTDMQGYSKAMGADESGAYARLVEHNRIMREAIAEHRGREIKTIGDAFLVIFRSARRALDCALAVQRAFADYNTGKPADERLLVRIGIHAGEVILADADVFGDDVNLVSRIEPLADAGGICVSESVLEALDKRLRPDVQQVEGATLKNIASPPKLFRISQAALRSAPSGLSSTFTQPASRRSNAL